MSKRSVLVIGGGLGGLSAAISLKQSGFDVTIIEKNQHFGGKLNRHTQDGFGFDLGPSLLTMPEVFERLFKRSNRSLYDYLTLTELDLQWRTFFTDNQIIDLYADLTLMKDNNLNLSNKDIDELRDFYQYAEKLDKITQLGYFNEGFDRLTDIIKFHGPVTSLRAFDVGSTMQQAINKRVSNPHLRDLLGYFVKYVGSSAKHAPAILNMMAYMQKNQGVWYVNGGLHELGNAITTLAREIGINMLTGQQVQTAVTKNKMIDKVITSDGEEIQADIYVSNMEVIPFYTKVLDIKPKKLEKMRQKFPPASSGLVIHLGVNKEYPQLRHHNFFFSQDSDKNYTRVFTEHKLPEDPTIYLVNTNKTDPSQAPEGHENLKILPHIPPLAYNAYTEKDYADFRELVLEKLENMGLADLRKHIVTEHMLTPHDIESMYLSHAGAIYGTLSDKKLNKGFKHPKKSEIADNLYFVGGTVNPGGGMPMVTLSGMNAAGLITKEYMK